MKKYLNDYKNGIILKFDHKHTISQYDKDECFELIGDDDAIAKEISVGILRAYCRCDVIEWQNDLDISSNEQDIVCFCCNEPYIYDDGNEQTNEYEQHWIQGVSKKHKNLKAYLCGHCIIKLVIDATNKELIDIYSYLDDSLTNNHKINELCLVHRLFSSSTKLMQLLINSFCRHFEDSQIAEMLKVIDFVIKWVQFMWFEDFQRTSTARMLLNKFISFLLEQTNGKSEYNMIWKANQKLIKHYRDQNLLQQQLDAEIEVALLGHHRLSTIISPKIGYQQLLNSNVLNALSDDDEDSDIDNPYYIANNHHQHKRTTSAELGLIPSDLKWYGPGNDEQKQRFLQQLIQKRNSMNQFRKYHLQKNKKRKSLKKTESNGNLPKSLGMSPKSKSVHDLKTKKKSKRKSKINSDDLNHIKESYDIQHTKPKHKRSPSSKFSIFAGSQSSKSLLLQNHCHEFAAQLTLIAFDLFRAIRPTEFLRKAWTKKDKHLTAPNIAELIIFMEALTVWAKFEIAAEIHKYRKKTIERMCRIGMELLRLGNQYGAVQIYLSLISTDAKCFKHDLGVLDDSEEFSGFMQKIAKLIDSGKNHRSLRDEVWNLTAPAIPYLGVFLKDAFKADELLKISKLQRVDPKQMQSLFKVYDKIELFRTCSYSDIIQRNKAIIRYIQRELHGAKKLNVRALSKFCKEQASNERGSKRSIFG